MKYRIRNWSHFQHYKDRNPPWIKLHFELLSSADWVTLADASRVLAVVCMLVASRNEGEIDGSPTGLAYLQRVAYLAKAPDLKPLIECGFLEPIEGVLADASGCLQVLANARPETEAYKATEKEEALSVSAAPKPDDVPAEAILAGYRELLPDLPQPRRLDPDRKKKIIARWREDRERQSLEWWRNFWAYVAQSDFLTGRDGKWQSCNLDWLLEPKNMRKVTEGNYENRGNP